MEDRTIKEILQDHLDSFLEEGALHIHREQSIEYISGKGVVITGIRRSGKSTFLKQFYQGLAGQPIKPLVINFSDDRLAGSTTKDLNQILKVYLSNQKGQTREKYFVFFDEIQNVENWSLFVNRLIETKHAQVFMTGSSAKLLSKEISTELRGRVISYEMFPFGFHEMMKVKTLDKQSSTNAQGQLIRELSDQLKWGGFPEVYLSKTATLKRKILQSYFEVLLLKDLIERNQISDPRLAREIFYTLVHYFSSLVSIKKMTEILKSRGYDVQRAHLSNWFDWLTDCYAVFFISIYSRSYQVQRVNPKKLYVGDLGFVELISGSFGTNIGRRLENLIFLELRRYFNENEIFYYKTDSAKEVDFYVPQKKLLLNVCYSIEEVDTRNREINSLIEAMTELKIKESYIITHNKSESISNQSMTINILTPQEWLTSFHV
jgi:predicted AAA+ superfamily ATPase